MIQENKHDPLAAKANAAFLKAAHDVVKRARQANTSVVVWRDGKVVKLTPEQALDELAGHSVNPQSQPVE